MNKTNFTQAHKEELDKLMLSALYSGRKFRNNLGNQSVSISELLTNSSPNSLKTKITSLKREIDALEANSGDEFGMSDYEQRKLSLMKNDHRLYVLLKGYIQAREEIAEQRKELRNLKAEYEQLKESTKTPQDRLKEAEDKIKALEGTETNNIIEIIEEN